MINMGYGRAIGVIAVASMVTHIAKTRRRRRKKRKKRRR